MIFIKISGGLLDYFDKNIKSFKCTFKRIDKKKFLSIDGLYQFLCCTIEFKSNANKVEIRFSFN